MLTFEIPAYFLLLIFFPLLYYFLYLRKSRGGSIPYTFNVWNGRNLLHTPLSLLFLHVLTEIFFWLAMLSFVIALAGPSLAVNKKIFAGRGMDIMIVLDQSPSMAARDFGAEDRLTTAREMIKGFIKTRENDSLGLVTFSEEALLRLPPTIDHDRLNDTLEELVLTDRGDGTAIGMGLALGVLHLSTSTASEKMILLITDGDNNVGEIQPETAASMAAQLGIRIYTVGLGTTGEVPVEFLDRDKGKIITGTLASSFNGELLNKISEISGGSYFYARSSGSLETIFKIIDTIETQEIKTKVSVDKHFFHRELILAGLFFFFLFWFIKRILMGGIL